MGRGVDQMETEGEEGGRTDLPVPIEEGIIEDDRELLLLDDSLHMHEPVDKNIRGKIFHFTFGCLK